MVVLSILLIGSSVFFVLHAVSMSRVRVRTSLAQIEAYGFESDPLPEPERTSLIAQLGARLVARMGATTLADQRKTLLEAGMYRFSAEAFMGWRVICTIVVPVVTLQMSLALGPLGIGVIALAAVTGWTLPQTFMHRKAANRLEMIDRSMPELVDLLVVGVEAGQGFNGALKAAAARIHGPLGDELNLSLQEQSLGVSLSDALNRMLHRCDTPATRSFVRAITQGDKLGISIGQVLRDLASEMRKRRKAKAEELAHKAPVKILFPLVFLIFPSIFIVLLTPAAISISENL